MKRLSAIALGILLLNACQPPIPATPLPATAGDDWALTGFVKADSINPILKPGSDLQFTCPLSGLAVKWEERNVLNPAAIVKGDSVYLFYRAQDLNGTSRIGLAVSADGLHFTKMPAPVLYPDADNQQVYKWNAMRPKNSAVNSTQKYFDGVEDPRIVSTENGEYIITYTAYDGKTARLCMATSKDLLHWQKKGLVLKEAVYKNYWSKSGAIVVKQSGSQMIAAKINNRYWMYFGDTDIFLASSTDLTNWQVATFSESKKMVPALQPRPGYFDSRLVEPGPYALLTEKGILLIYNASNAADYNDILLPKFSYAAAQALFDTSKPYQLIKRQSSYFIHPDKEYEKVGEVNEVCFVEGLVYFKNKWFLYYGTADSKIAVAVKEN